MLFPNVIKKLKQPGFSPIESPEGVISDGRGRIPATLFGEFVSFPATEERSGNEKGKPA